MATPQKQIPLKDRYFTADQLAQLSAETLHKYCFIDGDVEEWDDDFNNELYSDEVRYKMMLALFGQPLSYLQTRIYMTVSPWLAEGKKLNPKLLYTLQSILMKNPTATRTAALTGKANKFLVDSCHDFAAIMEKAFAYETAHSQDD